MNVHIPFLLLFIGFGAYGCIWGAKRWLRQRRGEQQYTLTGQPIPWVVWPLVIFSGLMCIAASVPVLLGQPTWLLDKVFSIFARLLQT